MQIRIPTLKAWTTPLTKAAVVYLALTTLIFFQRCFADVSHGTPEAATNYYRGLAKEIAFSTPDNIFASTLDTVASYLG